MMHNIQDSVAGLMMPVVLLQMALYVTAMFMGVGDDYAMLFIVQISISLVMMIATRKVRGDLTIVISAILLMNVGGFIQTVLSEEISGYENGGRDFMIHLIISFLVFVVAMICINGNGKLLKSLCTDKGCYILFTISIVLYGICIISGRIHGAANWLYLGDASVQLTELNKFIYVWILGILSERDCFEQYGGRILCMFFIHATCLIVASELGFLIIIALLTVTVVAVRTDDWHMLLSAMKRPALFIAISMLIAFVVGGAAYGLGEVLLPNSIHSFIEFNMEKVKGRALGFMFPEAYSTSYGYQGQKVSEAIFNSGLLGTKEDYTITYIPVAESDMVLAAIISKMGIIMGVVVISIYLLFLISGMHISLKKNSVLAMTFVQAVFIQTCYNLASVMGVMPVCGITLPFVSAGGTSMVTMAVTLAILVSVSGEGGSILLISKEREKNDGKKKKNYSFADDWDLPDDFINGNFSGESRNYSGSFFADR